MLGFARFQAAALPHADKAEHAGRYALLTRTEQHGRQRDTRWSLWFDQKDEGLVELWSRNVEPGGPSAALDANGLTLHFHYAWNGQAGHLIVGGFPSDQFWGAHFRRSMPEKGGLVWQEGRIADDNLDGRVTKAKSAAAPPTMGLAPIAYAIQSPSGFCPRYRDVG